MRRLWVNLSRETGLSSLWGGKPHNRPQLAGA